MKTLLEKAQSITKNRVRLKYDDEDVELALAWANSQITTGQVIAAWECSNGAVYAYLAQALAKYIRESKP